MKKIEAVAARVAAGDTMGLMGHVVACYPDRARSLAAAKGICAVADFLEVQFPFSDPSADGPVIEAASYRAIDAGFTAETGFDIVKELSGTTDSAIIIMTYANIVYNYGVERFVARAAAAGAAALIVPDLPVESDEGLLSAAHAAGIGVIQVAAPGAGAERIRLLAERTDGVLYVTARRGITGGATMIGADTQEWIKLVKANCAKPIALGFGIRNAEQVNALKGLVPVVVAGSCFVERIGALQPDEDAEKTLAAFARALMG